MIETITHGLLTFSMLMLLSKDRKPEDNLLNDVVKTFKYLFGSRLHA